MVTSVKPEVLKILLNECHYDEKKTEYIIDGFTNGFSLGYSGDRSVKRTAPNLRLTVGDEIDLWNKVMKEVKLKRYAGPFEQIPFKDHYIQSPIGLVPKDNGVNTRLSFHLSYPRNNKCESVNSNTPKELCSVKYPSFDLAIKRCLEEGVGCYLGRSDFSAAFRNLGIKVADFCWLVMKARDPLSQEWRYFIDKCLPFGASISCAIFQAVSDAIAYIVQYATRKLPVNYLDDYLFIALLRRHCDEQMKKFISICEEIHFPINLDKMFWGMTILTFLGLLIDTVNQIVAIPCEKITLATNMISHALGKKNRKITIKKLQKICGCLNFLGHAVIPGRAFTRCIYANINPKLKQHHHIKINHELAMDLETWLIFLRHLTVYARPFLDFTEGSEKVVDFYSDASKNPDLGMGANCDGSWMFAQWEWDFIMQNDPSIEYLELYALTAAVLAWLGRYKNRRIIIFCDNQSIAHMVNNTSSSCKNCMILICMIVLQSLINNIKIRVHYVPSKENKISDSLSHLRFDLFRKYVTDQCMDDNLTAVSADIWPINNIWLKG